MMLESRRKLLRVKLLFSSVESCVGLKSYFFLLKGSQKFSSQGYSQVHVAAICVLYSMIKQITHDFISHRTNPFPLALR